MNKSRKEPPGYWQHRGRGYNYHLGYREGESRSPTPIKEKCFNITIKEGK